MTDRSQLERPSTWAPEASGPVAPERVLTASGIEKSYRLHPWSPRGRSRVLTGADLALARGEVVGLVGENGSGKSTLMRILVGDLRADAGTVTRAGQVGYCPQEPLVHPRLTRSLSAALASEPGRLAGLRVAVSGLVLVASTALAARVTGALDRAQRPAQMQDHQLGRTRRPHEER